MTPVAFVDIDTQVDFIEPHGKLYAAGAEAIKGRLGRLVEHALASGAPLVSSLDTHAEGDPEFERFPPHCLKGTKGHEKIAETRSGRERFITMNDVTFPDPRSHHVVLEKDDFPVFAHPLASEVFAATGAQRFYVFGVVTEVCVKAAVLGLLARGYQVTLVEDAVWPISAEGGAAALAEMFEAGAQSITTAELLEARSVAAGRGC